MDKISHEIINDYQIRKNKKQKTKFIELLKRNYPMLRVESGGLGKNRNIIIGDLEKSNVVLTAHYDTCAVLPFPNFITPKNPFIYILYQVLIAFLILAISYIVGRVATVITDNHFLGSIIYNITLLVMLFCIIAGKPNKHTANDNTSGIITLLEILNNIDDIENSNVAFVFFDNEEAGLLGSAYFKKVHKKIMKDKLLINFDCVSDGDNIMVIQSKKAIKKYEEIVKKSFVSNDSKNVLIEKSITTVYPSDQILFPCHIGVAALKKSKLFGYYMDKIHTNKDIEFDEKNIEFIKNSVLNLLSELKS